MTRMGQVFRTGVLPSILVQARRTLTGQAITLNEPQLHVLLERLHGCDTALPITGHIKSKLDGTMSDYEFLVDGWPTCKAVVCRVKRRAAQFPVHLGPKSFFFAWDQHALHRLLGQPGVIDWSSALRFQYTDDLNPAVMRALQTAKRQVGKIEVLDFWMVNRSTVIDITPPKGFFISSLRPDQADVVNSTWAERDQQSMAFIEHLLKVSKSACLYNTERELVGYAVRYHDGEMGMLHVFDRFRRQGYAKVIMSHLAHLSLETHQETFAIAKNSEAMIKINEAFGMSRLPYTKMLYCMLDD